ncbi:hypothetical protein SAMN05660350_01311 [Geodermatophilus obscurus]|uniref:Uncharacterized protein n=1 Tax=Geodermatophilus obscurus TaxID=1861 RepID=A0A1M7T3A3_9ACTN|nr:hypothetical protein SAMN05660350_01311 [Geodermatophilus obscurus]
MLTVLRRFAPVYRTVTVWARRGPVPTDVGVPTVPDRTFEQVPPPALMGWAVTAVFVLLDEAGGTGAGEAAGGTRAGRHSGGAVLDRCRAEATDADRLSKARPSTPCGGLHPCLQGEAGVKRARRSCIPAGLSAGPAVPDPRRWVGMSGMGLLVGGVPSVRRVTGNASNAPGHQPARRPT